MAKNSKWGNIVFYKTKEGKLRWFDPDKAKTPEGKAKIKAIRMGKGYQGKTTDMDEERVAKAKKALETKKAGAVERKARAAEEALNKQFDKNPTTSKDKNELRRLANEKANAVGDLYYSLSGNKDKVGSPSLRDLKNIDRAKKKAEERAHIKEVKEKATNPNFDAEKYAKYFDKDGKLTSEKFDEWYRKQKGEELNKKSAEAQKKKDGIDKALEEYPKVVAENKKALDDKYGKDPRILARDWAKKVHEGADREEVVKEIGEYAKGRGLSSKERDDIIADVDKAVSYNKTHSSDPKEIKKANDAFVKKTSVKPVEAKAEKVKWSKNPEQEMMGFREGTYKGMTITESDGSYFPEGFTVNFNGDEAYASSLKDAMRQIDEYAAKNAPKGRTGSAPSKARAKLSPMTPERKEKAAQKLYETKKSRQANIDLKNAESEAKYRDIYELEHQKRTKKEQNVLNRLRNERDMINKERRSLETGDYDTYTDREMLNIERAQKKTEQRKAKEALTTAPKKESTATGKIGNNASIHYSNSSGTSEFLGNINWKSKGGDHEKESAVEKVIRNSNGNAKDLVKALNSSGLGDKNWEVIDEKDGVIRVQHTDAFGSKHILKVNKNGKSQNDLKKKFNRKFAEKAFKK